MDISIIRIGFRSLVIFAHHRLVVALSFAAQLPTNTHQDLKGGSATRTEHSNHGDVPAHQGSDIAWVYLQHALVLRDCLLRAAPFLESQGIVPVSYTHL